MHQAIQAAIQSFDDAAATERLRVTVARQAAAAAQRDADEAQYNVDQIVAAGAALRQQAADDAPAPSAVPVSLGGDAPAAPSPGPYTRPAALEQLAAAMAQVEQRAVPYPTTPPGV